MRTNQIQSSLTLTSCNIKKIYGDQSYSERERERERERQRAISLSRSSHTIWAQHVTRAVAKSFEDWKSNNTINAFLNNTLRFSRETVRFKSSLLSHRQTDTKERKGRGRSKRERERERESRPLFQQTPHRRQVTCCSVPQECTLLHTLTPPSSAQSSQRYSAQMSRGATPSLSLTHAHTHIERMNWKGVEALGVHRTGCNCNWPMSARSWNTIEQWVTFLSCVVFRSLRVFVPRGATYVHQPSRIGEQQLDQPSLSLPLTHVRNSLVLSLLHAQAGYETR